MLDTQKLYYSIGEVSQEMDLPQSQLRYWSVEFDMNIRKNRKGDRLFVKEDIQLLYKIKKLLKEDGYTIEGAKKQMKINKKENISSVSELKNNDQIISKLIDLKSKMIILRKDLDLIL